MSSPKPNTAATAAQPRHSESSSAESAFHSQCPSIASVWSFGSVASVASVRSTRSTRSTRSFVPSFVPSFWHKDKSNSKDKGDSKDKDNSEDKGNSKHGRTHRLMRKVKEGVREGVKEVKEGVKEVTEGLKARKFKQKDPKAEESYKKFMETPPVVSDIAEFTSKEAVIVNGYILRVRGLLYPKEQKEPDEWPTQALSKHIPNKFLHDSIKTLPPHFEKCTERLKEQTKAAVQPQAGSSSASLKSKIASSLDTEVRPLQRAVEPPADIPGLFWETPLGKSFKNLQQVLIVVHQDLKDAEDKLNKVTVHSQNEPATGISSQNEVGVDLLCKKMDEVLPAGAVLGG